MNKYILILSAITGGIISTKALAITCPEGTFEGESCWDCSMDGGNCTASLKNGTFLVSGQGKMKIYGPTSSDVPWGSKRREIHNIIIEDGITSISTYAFYYSTNVENATIAPSVQYFGEGAFRGAVIQNMVTATPNVISNFFFNPTVTNIYCLDENCATSKLGGVAQNIYQTRSKEKNGATYIYDENGLFLTKYGKENPPKRIYTIDEASRLSKPTGNTFKLRYK